ncbi:MAG: hypothetical protein IIA59_06360 [Candidatus Marinimicrobia bacterium]|nr:hypothetical protein [Candidatus Neomarinimicrobiota bacterium]
MRCRSIPDIIFLLMLPLAAPATQEPSDSLDVLRTGPDFSEQDSTAILPAELPPELLPLKRFYGPAWRYLPAFNAALFTFDTTGVAPLPQKQAAAGALVTSGTLYRGLTVSSGQGAILSGGLDLQVQGVLAGGLFLQATLTDRNLPIQPEGNTRSLQELDQVKLTISGPWGTVTAGDFILRGGGGPLTSFSRKLEGMTAQIAAPGSSWKLRGAVAGSKGKFRSQSMSGVSGRQGPYRLSAEDGSQSLVVLAGTETVWLDGARLERGDRFDYTIDYQTGELFFTPRHAIYSDSRITVDFEYARLVYSQTTGFMEGSWQSPRSSLVLSAYSRRDDPASSLAFSLSPQDRQLLMQSGDAVTALTVSGATADSAGGYELSDEVYVWVGVGQGSYAVAFQRVGTGGSYRRLVAGNRLVYQWVAPENRMSGEAVYAPYRQLIAPTSHEVLAVLYEFRGREQGRMMRLETALSRYDLNRLSVMGSGGQTAGGFAAHSAWRSGGDRDWVPSFDLKAQGKGSQFQPLGRWDAVEMAREWDLEMEPAGYNWMTAIGRLEGPGGQSLSVESGQLYSGVARTNRLGWGYARRGRTGLEAALRQTRTSGGIYSTIKDISTANIKYHFKHLTPFIDYFEEDRSKPDSLDFNITRLHIGTAVELGHNARWRIGRERRAERYANGQNEDADLWRVGVDLGKRRWGRLESDIAFNRSLSRGATSSSADYLLGTVRFRRRPPGAPWWIDFQHRIERTASESRAVLYDSVGAGLGRYRYDANYDSFVPDEAGDYVRRVVPVGISEPLVAVTSRLAGQLQVNKLARPPAALKKWPEARIAWQVNLESRSQARSGSLLGSLSPDDEAALFYRGRSRLEMSWQRIRRGPRYALRVITTANLSRLQIVEGLSTALAGDRRAGNRLELQRSHTVTPRARPVSLDSRLHWETKELRSTINSRRNMSIVSRGFEGTAGTVLAQLFAEGGALSGSLTGRWMRETNAILDNLSVDLYGATLGLAQPVGKTGRLRLDLELLEVRASENTTLPLAMAEGLPVGLSTRIRFSGQVPLASNLMMTLSFFSRNPAGGKPVRTANLELRTRL